MDKKVCVYAAGTKRQNGDYSYRFYVGQRPTGFDVITCTGHFFELENYETGRVTIEYWEESRVWPQPSFTRLCRMERQSGLKTVS